MQERCQPGDKELKCGLCSLRDHRLVVRPECRQWHTIQFHKEEITKVQTEATIAEGVAAPYLRKLARLHRKGASEPSLGEKKGSDVCRAEGNRIGEARQPGRARSVQEGASLLGGALQSSAEQDRLEGTQDQSEPSSAMETRVRSHAECQKGEGCSRKGRKGNTWQLWNSTPMRSGSLLHFRSWLSTGIRLPACLSGCTLNLNNPRPQLDENLVLLKHIFCSGDCEYHFKTKILDV